MSLESIFKLSLIMNMVDNLTGPMGRVSSSVGGSVSKLDSMGQSMANMTRTGAVMAGVGAEITNAVLAPVEATFATRRAIGELSSLGVQDLQVVEDAARHFSDTWAGTTKADFITAAYDIKSGIASLTDEGVAQFTELAGLTAKATKSSTAEMTSLFATGYGIYKDAYADLSDLEFGAMFSGGIAASVKQFKTTGTGMAQAIQTLGASATTASVPLEEQLSILGMLQATMGGGEAGTKYKAFLRSAVRGGEELGLSFMDANNQLLSLPEILDKLQGKFGTTMDAAEKLELQKAFGDAEAVALIDLMYSKTGDLQGNILGMYDALGSGLGVTQQMAEAMNNMEPDRVDVLMQNLHNVAEVAGNTVLPTIVELTEKASKAAIGFGDWAEKNQGFVRVIMLILLAFGGFLAVAGTAIAVTGTIGLVFAKTFGAISAGSKLIGKLPDLFDTIRLYGMFAADGLKKGFTIIRSGGTAAIGAIKNVAISVATMAKTAIVGGLSALKGMAIGLVGMAKQAIITAATALPGLIASVWSFTTALLANPITWVVVGIIALIAAIVLLWKNWDKVTSFLGEKWNAFCSGFQEKMGAAVDAVKGFFSGIGNTVGTVMDAAKATVSEKLGNMTAAYEAHGGGITGITAAAVEGVKGFFTAGFTFVDHLTGGKLSEIKNKFTDYMGGIAQGVGQKFNAVKTAFTDGINRVKDTVTGAVSWFFDSGKRVVSTFADGIKGAFSAPINAVKNGLQKIRNMLPFSDAKEGPLSTLTLSGQRVMTTFASGVALAQDAPEEAVFKSLGSVRSALSRPVKSVRVRAEDEIAERDGGTGGARGGIIIKKLVISPDISKIKDLHMLLNLVKELADGIQSNGGDDEPSPEPA